MLKIQLFYPNKFTKTYFGEFVKFETQGVVFSISGFYDEIGFYHDIAFPARSLYVSGIPFSAVELNDTEFENLKRGTKDEKTFF